MRAQSGPVEGVLVGHVEPQALRRLAGVADRPAPVIEFAGDVLDERLGAVHLDVLEHLVGETELLGEEIHDLVVGLRLEERRSEEHTSELQSLMRISYAVFCLKKKKNTNTKQTISHKLNVRIN